jgi:multidrug efflux pump subunit AcrB
VRLRPIIMTTAAMIFGMLPLAHAVIGGLITTRC